MAFDAGNFDPTASGSKGACKIGSYSSPDDFSTIETDGYFDGAVVAGNLKTGDFLLVYSSAASGGGAKLYNVTVAALDVALSLAAALS